MRLIEGIYNVIMSLSYCERKGYMLGYNMDRGTTSTLNGIGYNKSYRYIIIK